MKMIFASFAFAASALMAFAFPEVKNVRFEQDKSSRVATIKYDLGNDNAVVTLDILTNGVSIGLSNIRWAEGDVNKVVQAGNDKEIKWDAILSWPNNKIQNESVTAKVTAWPINDPPNVMVVDLTKQNGARTFYEDVSQLPGSISDRCYKTEKLVFRKIPAKGEVFQMGGTNGVSGGATPRTVAFTNDYYLGVYEVTQRQLEYMTSLREARYDGPWRGTVCFKDAENADILPVDSVAYGSGESGKTNSLMAWYSWNASSRGQGVREVYAQSLLAHCRSYTGLKLDLPTSAQWEYACRAGAKGVYYNNKGVEDLGEIAWYSENSNDMPHPVGSKVANAFGLYDMLGNVLEWVLDYEYSSEQASYEIDPPGPSSHDNSLRMLRGGAYKSSADSCRIWSRNAYIQNYAVYEGEKSKSTPCGFRLWACAEAQ